MADECQATHMLRTINTVVSYRSRASSGLSVFDHGFILIVMGIRHEQYG
jgi:hypothetical protein